jgi:phosphoribosylformylglycinamidine synthase
MPVYRVFTEKKQPFANEADNLFEELSLVFRLGKLRRVRILNRYDIEGVSRREFEEAVCTLLSDPVTDNVYDNVPDSDRSVAVEYLPGQYDARAQFTVSALELMTQKTNIRVRCARVLLFDGDISDGEFEAVKGYLINRVDSRTASRLLPETLEDHHPQPPDVGVAERLTRLEKGQEQDFIDEYALAMDVADLVMCREYFLSQGRAPTVTELRLIDTYWSDHCRHTTFLTRLEDIVIERDDVKKAYDDFLKLKAGYNRAERPVTLMEIATIAAKAMHADGRLPALDLSDEVNACSVHIEADVGGVKQPWVLMFKNETHNHPTEIEPFGGAATCLGGAIRDPLSGRAYVYQAMRVSGGANPLAPIEDTIQGKLPQRKIALQAAAGYSCYSNQIGVAAGLLCEYYHPGYVAKRLEAGAVIAAAPAENIRREAPCAGDIVLVIGAETGRDGCGGAASSSKSHDEDSLSSFGAEVQKGNASEERKLQRLFRNKAAARLMKRCNDFGAGGVSVAVGELAESLDIDLDRLPVKYPGLDGTELAISESQERMAVVMSPGDAPRLIELAAKENLNAVPIAMVTDTGRIRMRWRGKLIVDIKRSFLDTNGAEKKAAVRVAGRPVRTLPRKKTDLREGLVDIARDINLCSKKGLIERFDASAGGLNVLAPLGGKYRETPAQVMASLLPLEEGASDTVSLMSCGFDPFHSQADPFAAAQAAVCESVAKVVAAGGSRSQCWLSFQEYFGKPGNVPERWGLPFMALLGALEAQMALECAAIGGKDSMSGSFGDIDVPPTFISFAVSVTNANRVVSSEFKRPGSRIVLIELAGDGDKAGGIKQFAKALDGLERQISQGNVLSARVCSRGGIAEAVFCMALGNKVGASIDMDVADLFKARHAGVVVECEKPWQGVSVIGSTSEWFCIECEGQSVRLEEIRGIYSKGLSALYPFEVPEMQKDARGYEFKGEPNRRPPAVGIKRPGVVIPVFPGTNGEIELARAFSAAGAVPEILIFRNRHISEIEDSIGEFVRLLGKNQILAIPGGSSGGDEPDGAGKFISAFLRSPLAEEAILDLIEQRDGLILGICNGFQALVRCGLLPHGKIIKPEARTAVLAPNTIGRHQSMSVTTRVASVKSPWMMHRHVGQCAGALLSCSEGRFSADSAAIASLAENGQIVAQYVDASGVATMDIAYNPCQSDDAIESICSADGRTLGCMTHPERSGSHIFKNIGADMTAGALLFRGGVDYFSL